MKALLAMAIALMLVGCDNAGRYQIATATANNVWRVDTKTGEVSYCGFVEGKVGCATTLAGVPFR
jgi:hypothetical protein